ncbi:alpha/beta fold hydrolase [Opitutaceae bacterium TAV4]|nr:alpha/beta fold hydrolase [Opitutaceae bacterium TAV4]RRK02263.1 alpha/beta fold hydrolase [Opitutaceae bacterium TAV3]
MRALKRRIIGYGLCCVLGYLGYCLLLAGTRDELLFPVHGRERAAGRSAPGGMETWWLSIPAVDAGMDAKISGRVEAWWCPAKGASAEAPAPAVIYFHGNGELIDDGAHLASIWNGFGVSVLMVEYRGYGRSDGNPSADNVIEDSLRWYDRVVARPEVRAGAILAHGYSLGGAFAAQLAARRPVAGVVLESTFASVPRMARAYGVWVYFPSEALDGVRVLRELPSQVPVLITHGILDRVVPVAEGRVLAAARKAVGAVMYHEDNYPHGPGAQDEPGHGLLRRLLAEAVGTGEGGASSAF